MQQEDAVFKADDILFRIIQTQPQFIPPVFDHGAENGVEIAKQILSLRQTLIDGLKIQS